MLFDIDYQGARQIKSKVTDVVGGVHLAAVDGGARATPARARQRDEEV
jgi:guanylate kinase